MENVGRGAELRAEWQRRVLGLGADFVYFVDITPLPVEATEGYPCAVLFGKALSRPYLAAMRDGLPPEKKEVINVERKMDALADKLAAQLCDAGYESVARLKTGQLPHKTVALRAGLGFIGKNNLLVTPEYGCGQMLGKVLTRAPFEAEYHDPTPPQCGECRLCADACPTGALAGKEWTVTTRREEIITRKSCVLCVRCMVACPHTARYIDGAD